MFSKFLLPRINLKLTSILLDMSLFVKNISVKHKILKSIRKVVIFYFFNILSLQSFFNYFMKHFFLLKVHTNCHFVSFRWSFLFTFSTTEKVLLKVKTYFSNSVSIPGLPKVSNTAL